MHRRLRILAVAVVCALALIAVRNNDILVMKFDYMDPPTPLSVQGLEKVAEAFGFSTVIFAEHVTFAYAGVPALAGVGLTARPGQVVGLIGPNGSGKTTLLRTLYAALIARTLAQRTDHPLLDEPTNHLDIRYQHEILQLVLLDDGRVVCTGTPEAVLTPEVLEPVYGIGVRRLIEGGSVQLIFNPADAAPRDDDPGAYQRRMDDT